MTEVADPLPETGPPARQVPAPLRVASSFLQLRWASILLVAIALGAYFAFSSPSFLTRSNILVIAAFLSEVAIITAGEVMLMICGEIDLSVGFVAALAPRDLRRLHDEARALDLDVLVEVHDERELEAALDVDAEVIGINNRDLADFSVDIDRTFDLLSDVPAGKAVVSESGYSNRAQLEDQGFVKAVEQDGQKLFELTEAGREHLSERSDHKPPWEEEDDPASQAVGELRSLVGQVAQAAIQVSQVANEQQMKRAGEVLTEARRALYRILAEDSES